MKNSALLLTLFAIVMSAATASASTCNKRFRKALVLAGGGFNPGMAIGILAAAKATGQTPDVILTTCGASIAGAIANNFENVQEARQFVKSRAFYEYVNREMQVGRESTISMGLNLGRAMMFTGGVPDTFSGTVMNINPVLPKLMARQQFSEKTDRSRLVILGARALYTAADAGHDIDGRTLYVQTYFTDKDTAKYLEGMRSSVRLNFPNAPIHHMTEVRTDISTLQAARASIADPYLVNPARIGDAHYFTGAIDLWPIETAQSLACDVTVTSPSGNYDRWEDGAVQQGFGFSQQARLEQLSRYRGVNWINMVNTHRLAMDPQPAGLEFISQIPKTHAAFATQVEKQFQMGYYRGMLSFSKRAKNKK